MQSQGEIGVGIIGTGFMGACHAMAFAAVGAVFEPELRPRLEIVADLDLEAAERARSRFGFARATADWRALVIDPKVALVAITTPNHLHKPMALAAVAAGKHVYCEKPLALTAAEAEELTLAAEAAGVCTLVGYNYLRSPALQHVKALLDAGAIGELTYLRVAFEEDFMADPAVPFSWRCARETAGAGALGDLGSHAIGMALHLAGPIASVLAEAWITVASRPVIDARPGESLQFARVAGEVPALHREVENDDAVHALVRFASGARGSIAASRVAWGRKNGLDLDLVGRKGAIRFRQERFNEFQLFLADGSSPDENGFRTVLTGPGHPDYGRFSPAPGHGLGFNDLKTIEVAQLLAGVAGRCRPQPDFRTAWAIARIGETMETSSAARAWMNVSES